MSAGDASESSLLEACQRYWPPIAQRIEEVVPRTEDERSLEAMIWTHLDSGGKRLRAGLPPLVAECLTGRAADAFAAGAAVELIHNATLIHDDIQDGDTERRGAPALWTVTSQADAMNCGDALFFYGLQALNGSPCEPDVLQALHSRVHHHLIGVIRGQVEEARLNRASAPRMEHYLRVIRGKTSGLFALPMELGALVSGAPSPTVQALSELGTELGVLFQLQDDLLDLIADKGRAFVGSDIAEGKRSHMVVDALGRAKPTAREELLRILDSPRDATSQSDISHATDLLKACGSLQRTARRCLQLRDTLEQRCAALPSATLATQLRAVPNQLLRPVEAYLTTLGSA